MRKWLCILLVLVLPVSALAVPSTPYDPSLMVHYPLLTPSQQQVFDQAYAAIAVGMDSLPISATYDDVTAAMDALRLDCPELCAYSYYSISYYRDQPQQAIGINFTYTTLSTLVPTHQAELLQAARLIAAAGDGDELATEEYLHDYLCTTVTYDLTAENQHSAYGALVEHRAVCDGYAKAMALLLRLSGIRCGVVEGTLDGEGHAWNLVQVNGSYTWLDVSSDANGDQPMHHFFFNLTDSMLAQTHTLSTADMPACTDMAVNWHVYHGCYVQDEAPQWPQGETTLELRFAHAQAYQSFVDGLDDWLRQSGKEQCVYLTVPAQQCLRLEAD